MAAWIHWNPKGWDDDTYNKGYRAYVSKYAAELRGREEDCADLSMYLLIRFAMAMGLPVTFQDVDGWRYMSKADRAFGPGHRTFGSFTFDVEPARWPAAPLQGWLAFYKVVMKYIQTKSLFQLNTEPSKVGPQPGDLMIRYTESLGHADNHHTALVYEVYSPGALHPKWQDRTIPDFPGNYPALDVFHQTEYFRGTTKPSKYQIFGSVYADDNVTDPNLGRKPDTDVHFDYLNSRADKKRNAELIYFANARQFREDGFQFFKYGKNVLDNWSDWDGKGSPPR